MKGNLLLLITAVLWGTGFVCQKKAVEIMPPMTFNAIRQLMAAIVLLPLTIRGASKSGYLSKEVNKEELLHQRKKTFIKAGLLCGLFTLTGTALQQIGLVSVSAGKSGFITSLYIVIVPVFSVVVGSKVSIKSVICVIVAMFGFAVMSLRGGLGNVTTGDWLTLICAAAFAAQIVTVNQFVDDDNPLIISNIQFLVCGVLGTVIAVIAERPSITSIIAGLPLLLYQTIVPTAGGFTLQIVAQKYADSTTSALIMSTEAIFAAIFGALILGEWMSGREVLGAAIIFAAIIIGQIELRRDAE